MELGIREGGRSGHLRIIYSTSAVAQWSYRLKFVSERTSPGTWIHIYTNKERWDGADTGGAYRVSSDIGRWIGCEWGTFPSSDEEKSTLQPSTQSRRDSKWEDSGNLRGSRTPFLRSSIRGSWTALQARSRVPWMPEFFTPSFGSIMHGSWITIQFR